MFDTLDDLLTSYGPPAGAPRSDDLLGGPGLTLQSFRGALGPDAVSPAYATPVPNTAPTAPTIASPRPGSASGAAAGDLLGDISNAGVSSVPTFQAPVNPATPVHHSFISGLLGKIGHVAQTGYNNFTTNLAGLSSADLATMSPQDIAQAKRTALQAYLNRMANKQYDARGFRENGFQASSAGIGAGHVAADQFVRQAQGAQQFRAQQAQVADLRTKRAALQSQFQILPTDTPDQVTDKVQQLAAGYAAIGDAQSLQALGQASSLFRQPKPPAPARSLQHVETIDPSTGKPAIGMIDPATGDVVKYLPAVPKADPSAHAMSAEQQDKSIDRVVKTFQHETADFSKARAGYEVICGALATPNLYQPYALLDGFSRLVNPNSVVRPSTLELLKETGSAPERVARWASLIDKGVWPADLTAALRTTVETIMKNHATTAQAARTRALARLRTMKVDSPETYLDDLNYTGGAPATPAAAPATTSSTRGNY